MRLGLAGEFRAVVLTADGEVKTDTGVQRNIILNQGLDFFGGGKGTSMFEYCLIGGGNAAPVATQTALGALLLASTPVSTVGETSYTYVDDGTGLYKAKKTLEYRFTAVSDINVSEVGLASQRSGPSSAYVYNLCTRALIKNTSGSPTTITVLIGEILVIYYSLYQVYSTADAPRQITLETNTDGLITYNTLTRISSAGGADYGRLVGRALATSATGTGNVFSNTPVVSNLPPVPITEKAPASFDTSQRWVESMLPYVNGTYKRVIQSAFNLTDANDPAAVGIRTLVLFTTMGAWQMRYGSDVGDKPIAKTVNHRLELPVEISWARYTGAL